MKECPICHIKKSIKQFRYGHAKEDESMICVKCMDKLSMRLSSIIEADKMICRALELDYRLVTDYEQRLRKKGIYREHLLND